MEEKERVIEYRKRGLKQEAMIIESVLLNGPDKEDVVMLKLALSKLKSDQSDLVNDVQWSHYPSKNILNIIHFYYKSTLV